MGKLSVKRGDTKKLTYRLNDEDGNPRDLTGVTTARVLIGKIGSTPAVDRDGTIATDRTSGIVSLTLAETDYGPGKLEGGTIYNVEVETLPGPLTHPDGYENPYEELEVIRDLG